MTSRTHDIFAFASLVTFTAYYSPVSLNLVTTIGCLIGCTVGPLLPDIDQETNRLWDLLPGGDSLGKLFKNFFLSHRTISHSLLGVFIFYKILGLMLPKILNVNYLDINLISASIMIGYLSHLFLDALTEEGLPLFFPLSWKIGFPPFKHWRITTGKWFEKLVVFPVIVVYIFWFVGNQKETLINVLRLVIK